MADFGIVSGALGIAALFNNCVECFEYIQIGRHCTRDFKTCQLVLDCILVRLSRWGAGMNITSENGPNLSPSDQKRVSELLTQMYNLFIAAEKVAVGYKQNATSAADVRLFAEKSDLDGPALALHHYLRSLALKRKGGIGLRKKVSWALYERHHMSELIEAIEKLLANLEAIYPATERDRLAISEVAELDEANALASLIDVANGHDEVLESAAKDKLSEIQDGSRIDELEQKGQAKVRLGAEWTEGAMRAGWRGGNEGRQSIGKASVSEDAKLHVGPSYGGKSIFD